MKKRVPPYFFSATAPNRIFNAINNKQKEYNWLITDYVCYPENINYRTLMNREYSWISGEDLTSMINNEDFQIIGGDQVEFDNGV